MKFFVRALKMTFIFFFCVANSVLPIAFASQDNWSKVAGEIKEILSKAVDNYEKGYKDQAMEMVADAYFGIFEGEKANMEIAVRRFIHLKKSSELEKGFADLRKAIKDGIKPADFRTQASNLTKGVNAAAEELDRKGVKVSSEF